MRRYLITSLMPLMALQAAACVTPLQRNLRSPDAPKIRLTQQPLTIRVMPPMINVPANEAAGQDTRTRLFLFLGLLTYSDSRGSILPAAQYYAQNLAGEVQSTLENTLGDAGLFQQVSAGRADLELHSELLHLYGAAYNKGAMMVSYGAASSWRRKYLPYGSAVLHLILADTRKGERRVVWEATLNGSYIPDAEDAETANKELENAATRAAVAAYRDLLSQLPARLCRVVARLGGRPAGKALPPDTFYLARLLPDSRYVERAAISSRNGHVMHSEIQVRRGPIFSAPDEWVLDPYQGGHEAWDDNSYERLSQRLATNFPLKRRNNARLWSLDPRAIKSAQAPDANKEDDY